MSLDVYLTIPGANLRRDGSGIFVRQGGSTCEISREEWDKFYPGREPIVAEDMPRSDRVYTANITHNLTKMANAAGIYKELWRPDEVGITHARQLIEPLAAGLARLMDKPEEFRTFNPPNGWGSYESLVRFVGDYLAACRSYPEAEVDVWR